MEKYTLYYLIALVTYITMIVHILSGGVFWALILYFLVMIFVNLGYREYYFNAYNHFLNNNSKGV